MVKVTSTINIDGDDYLVTWSYKAINSSEYVSSVTVKAPNGSIKSSDGNSSYEVTTGSGNSETTEEHEEKIAEVKLYDNDKIMIMKVKLRLFSKSYQTPLMEIAQSFSHLNRLWL